MKPAEAITIHKSQGSPYESVCVDLRRNLPRTHLYVALSRVTSLRNLFLIGQFKPPRPPGETDSTIIELNRLKTTKQLKFCFNSLERKFGIVISYHNVSTFEKHKAHIINDDWYKNCDIVTLSKTHTTASHNPELPGFELVHRPDMQRSKNTRGILVFVNRTYM